MKTVITLIIAGLAATMPLAAAEMDHSQHQGMDHSQMQHSGMPSATPTLPRKATVQLEKLGRLPASGKAREAGFDGRHVMESTSIEEDLRSRCAKASRGLIMLDNTEWSRCGGKPEGWAKGPGNRSTKGHAQHMQH